jgi:hypothetical protein
MVTRNSIMTRRNIASQTKQGGSLSVENPNQTNASKLISRAVVAVGNHKQVYRGRKEGARKRKKLEEK